jgi:hypothetical protein
MIACFLSCILFSTISMVTARHRLGFDSSNGTAIRGFANFDRGQNFRFFSTSNIFLLLPDKCRICRYRCCLDCRLASLGLFFIDVFARSTGAILWGVPSRFGSVVKQPEAKRFDGCNSSKADAGRTNGKSNWNRGDLLDRRYVHNSGWKPDCAGQNYDPRPSILEPSLQPSSPLPPMEPWAWGERGSPVRDQDRLWTRIHRRKPYV